MIDPKMFDRDRLIALLLDTMSGNVHHWRRLLEIVPDYMPPFPHDCTRTTIRVRYTYLRAGGHAGWMSGGYFWDCYGDEFLSVEHALLAVVNAPVPPQLLKPMCWSEQP